MATDLDVSQFDPIFVGMSGGKDSTALALWVRFESGWPLERVIFGFMDTDNEDALTYAYLDYVSSVLAPAKIVAFDPGIGFYDLCRKKKRFPGSKSRFCTEHLKILPKRRMFAQWIDEGRRPLNCTGVRTAEAHGSNDRGSAVHYDAEIFTRECRTIEDGRPKRKRTRYILDVCRPIVDWSLDQVWDMHRRYLSLAAVTDLVSADPDMEERRKAELIDRMHEVGVPSNPLYAMGASRVGCFPCINSRKAEIKAMARYRPGRIDFLREKETWVGEVRGVKVATFFPITAAPKIFRSKRVEYPDGRVFFVSTIDDIVRWSRSGKRGNPTEELFDLDSVDQPSACRIGGDCE
jgi:3'-phosphoadenosine 5'-phosphosulfate sulfotransferase (PAPS reductase)/FAD synthetase